MGSTRARTPWARAGAEPGRAGEVRREVAVPEPEPGRESESAQGRQAGEGVAREAPPATPRGNPGERVDDGVEIRRDVEPEELLVVAGVADDRQPPRVSAPDEAREEPGPAHATRQHRDPHVAARPVRRGSCARPGCGPWRARAPRSPRLRCTRPRPRPPRARCSPP